ncbi:MAG: electron transfer flavoprotein subunit alpha/FixB family protein [Eubacterium sp.]|nr:electron transfer flavoprotein subunit alpha/FixB family protein [Eubacterium sp.]
MSKEIWVYAENNQGEVAGVAAELLAKAQELADQMGGYRVAAVITGNENKAAKDLGALGAEKVYSLQHAELADYRCDVYAQSISSLVKEYQPDYFFFGATAIGSELAPTVAGLLKTGLAAHCVDLRFNGERLNCMVPAFGGKVVSEIYIPHARPVMASVRPGILDAGHAKAREAEVIAVDTSYLDGVVSGEEFLGFEENELAANNIETAEVIVSAGRGAASDLAWESINQIADKLGASIAYTRSFMDTGRVPDETSMIGTSGKSVRPNLLINAGISGASQYVCGIGKSKIVISIDKNPRAAVFGYSDYGVVADVDKILPALSDKL